METNFETLWATFIKRHPHLWLAEHKAVSEMGYIWGLIEASAKIKQLLDQHPSTQGSLQS